MFNWTTTTLINEMPSVKDLGSGKLRLGKHLFEKRWVESIRKAAGHNEELCEIELDMSKVKELIGDANVARLYIYVGLEGSEESIYANDWYRKGMPLSVSFANDTAKNMAIAIVDAVKKFNIFTKVKKVLDVVADDTKLTIKGTHEHQRIQKIAILVPNADSKLAEEKAVIEWALSDARYAATQPKPEEADTTPAEDYKAKTGVTIVKEGVNGFGTYSQILKDLRLPTAANTGWNSVQKSEMPVVGALYTQYIINYYAPSMANPSFTAVGNRSMSETTHVFWVKSDQIDAFETALKIIDPEGDNTLETVTVVANKRYNNKKAESVIAD